MPLWVRGCQVVGILGWCGNTTGGFQVMKSKRNSKHWKTIIPTAGPGNNCSFCQFRRNNRNFSARGDRSNIGRIFRKNASYLMQTGAYCLDTWQLYGIIFLLLLLFSSSKKYYLYIHGVTKNTWNVFVFCVVFKETIITISVKPLTSLYSDLSCLSN